MFRGRVLTPSSGKKHYVQIHTDVTVSAISVVLNPYTLPIYNQPTPFPSIIALSMYT